MLNTVLAYLISLFTIGTGVGWIVVGWNSPTSALWIVIGVACIAVGASLMLAAGESRH